VIPYLINAPTNQETSLKLWVFVIAALGVSLAGCHSGHRPPAPLGERAALEKLASAYDTVSEQLPIAPTGLTPQGKLRFVQQVFDQAGYDFSATLQALAQTPPGSLGTYHKDMMELVLLPDQGLSEQAAEQLYSAEQLASIKTIKALSTR
jgi:hypothetical protein